MCGIAGWLTKDGSVPDRATIEAMTASLTHRGPDDGGLLLDQGVGIGHRRLSIIDLSPDGRQPMSDTTGRWWIAYNGEVYNYVALRNELIQKGHRFNSETDTEVVLAAFIEWGQSAFHRLNGMFALAIWDKQASQAWLARDRFGIKPLVYSERANGDLIFGSEIKAVESSNATDLTVNEAALNTYLTLGYIPAPNTIYSSVKKLPHGTVAHWRQGSLTLNRWYDLRDHLADVPDDYQQAQEALRERLSAAVHQRLVADVPLGAFLSGGIDSSVVVALMATQSTERVKTFSISFPEEPRFDESRYAREVARLWDTDHTEFPVSSGDVLESIDSVLSHTDEPFGDSSALPTALVSQLTRQQVTVAISGDAADELFAGYRKYVGESYASSYSCLPSWLRRSVVEPLARSLPAPRTNAFGERVRLLQRFIESAAKPPADRHAGWMTLFDDQTRSSVAPDLASTGEIRWEETISALHRSWPDDSINQVLYGDLETCLPYDMFTKVDWMSMRSSLEVRVPFADPSVAELAFALPAEWKLSGRKRKRVLVDAFKDLLPPALHNRPKQGFELPLAYWFRGVLAPIFEEIVTSSIASGAPFDADAISGLVDEHRSGHRDHSARLWVLYAYCHWTTKSRSRVSRHPCR